MGLRIVCVCRCVWGCKGRITVGHSLCLANCLFTISIKAAEWVGLADRLIRLVFDGWEVIGFADHIGLIRCGFFCFRCWWAELVRWFAIGHCTNLSSRYGMCTHGIGITRCGIYRTQTLFVWTTVAVIFFFFL